MHHTTHRFAPMARILLACGLLVFVSTPVQAIGLQELYAAAQANDPTYREARHERDAGLQNEIIGRAGLLPQVSFSYSRSQNKGDRELPGLNGRLATEPLDYTSQSKTLQLRQPLYDKKALATYRRGTAQSGFSVAQFEGRSQELILRLTEAYTLYLQSQDQVKLAEAQLVSLEELQAVNQRLLEQGEGTRTDVLETQARHDVAAAELIEAKDQLENSRRALVAMVGADMERHLSELDPLREDFLLTELQPNTLGAWRELALSSNAELLSQQYVVEASRQEVEQSRSDHFPRVALVGSVGLSDSETTSIINQKYNVRSLGVQMSIPLYAGGGVTAAVAQASSRLEAASAELDAKTGRIMVELHKQFSLVSSSSARVEALTKAVQSSRLLVQATTKSVAAGTRINADVLETRRQLFGTQRNLGKAKYDYLLAYLRLRYTAGALREADLFQVASYFAPAPLPAAPGS